MRTALAPGQLSLFPLPTRCTAAASWQVRCTCAAHAESQTRTWRRHAAPVHTSVPHVVRHEGGEEGGEGGTGRGRGPEAVPVLVRIKVRV